jgi:hypothetical protein
MLPRVVFCLLAILATLSLTVAQEPKEVKGVVQDVDAVNGTITILVETATRKFQVKTFSLARPDLPVLDGAGKPSKLTDITDEARVTLTLAEQDVTAIRLVPTALYGTLVSINEPAGTIVLKTKMGEKAAPLAADVKIVHQNLPATLADLKPGVVTLATFALDKKTIVEVRAGRGASPLVYLSKGDGYLIDLDHEEKTADILVPTHETDRSLLRHLEFSPEATFSLLHQGKPFRDITFAEVSRGIRIGFWTDAATKKLVHLEMEMPFLAKRTVKELDPQKRRLVLEDGEDDKVLDLTPHVKVQNSKGPGQLKDIQVGTKVSCLLSPDRKSVEMMQIFAK